MATHALLDDSLAHKPAPAGARAWQAAGITVRLFHRIADVAAAWQVLETDVVSPGQSQALIRLWVAAQQIPEADQYYLLAERDGAPLALLPLWRRRANGIRLLSWFPGAHVGCNAPLVDRCRMVGLGAEGRAALWQTMLRGVPNADLIYLKAVPALPGDADLFAGLGSSLETETLYRAHFASWDEVNTTQRSKSRRKHDRQQGEKLEALGAVTFEAVGNGPEAVALLDTLFAQRAARFRVMGVPDPFVRAGIREFYDATAAAHSGVAVKLHVLRLDGEVVAMRYSIAAGDQLFCLISSMSDAPEVQPGSPGKQCLLRIMQTEFDAGQRVFDMGAGFTDEKRHWCNERVALRQHYIPLTPAGRAAGALHRGWQDARAQIKSNPKLLALAKAVRSRLSRKPTATTSDES